MRTMKKVENRDHSCDLCDKGVHGDFYHTNCECGMEKCYFDCVTEDEKEKWIDLWLKRGR